MTYSGTDSCTVVAGVARKQTSTQMVAMVTINQTLLPRPDKFLNGRIVYLCYHGLRGTVPVLLQKC